LGFFVAARFCFGICVLSFDWPEVSKDLSWRLRVILVQGRAQPRLNTQLLTEIGGANHSKLWLHLIQLNHGEHHLVAREWEAGEQ
jgi:hypothetical protein